MASDTPSTAKGDLVRVCTHAQGKVNVLDTHTQHEVYCRYLFPRDMFPGHDGDTTTRGAIKEDPFRSELRNLCLRRNDELLNNFEEHMLLANLGNIDWRALINLWSVLDYLTK